MDCGGVSGNEVNMFGTRGENPEINPPRILRIEHPKCPHCGARQERAASEIVKSMKCEQCHREFDPKEGK